MPFANLAGHRIHYALHGDVGTPLITFANGLTQNAGLWTSYAMRLADRGYHVLAYDMIGQGQSSKPILDIDLRAHADLLAQLLDYLNVERTHLAGISFGGVVALDFAIRYGGRLSSVALMSCFAELTPQLRCLGEVLYEGLTQVGLPYLQSLLYPMNMSSAWLAANRGRIPDMKRAGYIGNDLYALQNLMESFVDFEPLTPRLAEIGVPALLMNGEHDFFTPRECHELMRRHLPNCRLLLIQHAYHAFTLEIPDVTLRQLFEFFRAVDGGTWVGDGSVWIASERADGEPHAFACRGDHMRAIPLAALDPVNENAPAQARRSSRLTA